MARARAQERRHVGFLAHSVAEYVLGAALVAVGLHLTGAPEAVLVGVGGVLVLLNLCTDAPLGVVSALGRRAHHAADLVLVGALLASPLAALETLHVVGVVVAELIGLLLLRIERSTRYVASASPAAGAPPLPSSAGPAPAPGPASSAGTVPAVSPASAAARAGAAVQAGAALVSDVAPHAGALAGSAARRGARGLGVAVGMGRRAMRARAARREAGADPGASAGS